jgi:hypothetical protein
VADVKELEVLDAREPRDHGRWLELWSAWEEREPMVHPAYARLFARSGEQPLCAVGRAGEAFVLFPFILRPLALEPWAGEEPACDVTTPYGYGGAFVSGSGIDSAAFWAAFAELACARRVVSAFVRLSLFPEQILKFDGEVMVNAPNVVRSVDLPEEALWRDYAHKVRKNVSRARREGLVVERDESGTRLDEFAEIYAATMDRRRAEDDYYFPPSFFRSIVDEMPGAHAFFHVLHGARVVSTELVLTSRRHVYSFLGGTVADAFEMRPNDLLKHEVAGWARQTGRTAYVLGGGYGGADGILKYKLAFAPDGAVPFQVGRRVYAPDVYERLEERRRAWEAAQGREWKPRENFFPRYRA